MQISEETPEGAKQFLLWNVLQQAQRDGVAVSAIEQRMFLFAEGNAAAEDPEMLDKFDEECDDQAYEKKISKLLRRAYACSKDNPEESLAWATALKALRNEDFYGLVMVDLAGIPRPKPSILGLVLTAGGVRSVLLGLAGLLLIGLGFVFLSDLFVVPLQLPDWLKIVPCGICFYLAWLAGGSLGRISSRGK